MALSESIARRQSRRQFTQQPITLEELSFLLWATQGVHKDSSTRRMAPSAGGRHPLETYLSFHRVLTLKCGLYRYLPFDHTLCLMAQDATLQARATAGSLGQQAVEQSAVLFIWTVVPYRAEWRYGVISHKMIAMDAGHVCQNLYLACGSIGAGTCAIGAYDHGKMDALIDVDGDDDLGEFVAVKRRHHDSTMAESGVRHRPVVIVACAPCDVVGEDGAPVERAVGDVVDQPLRGGEQ